MGGGWEGENDYDQNTLYGILKEITKEKNQEKRRKQIGKIIIILCKMRRLEFTKIIKLDRD